MEGYRCSANEKCLQPNSIEEPDEQYDPYNIYAGRWHEKCWEKYGYGNFVFDPTYAGERLDEEDY